MASFTFDDIFGNNSQNLDIGDGFYKLAIQLNDFQGQSNNGDLPDEQGISDPSGMSATQVFYGLILHILATQAPKINDDPDQKIFITDGGKSILTGARDGQVARKFVVTFFQNAGLSGTASIDAFSGT